MYRFSRILSYVLAVCLLLTLALPFLPQLWPAKDAAEARTAAPAPFRLPAGLQVIGDEAFEGIAAEAVELPDSLTAIGERAFAGAEQLQSVRLPESIETIGKDAFLGAPQLTVVGVSGGKAEDYARKASLPFRAENPPPAEQPTRQTLRADTMPAALLALTDDVLAHHRPSGRQTAELTAMRRQERAELHFQLEYFP